MPRGGARAGAGRPVGSRTRTAAEKAAEGMNQTPLGYMLRVMCDPEADPARRDAMAIAAAQYVHPLARNVPSRSPHDQFLPTSVRGTL